MAGNIAVGLGEAMPAITQTWQAIQQDNRADQNMKMEQELQPARLEAYKNQAAISNETQLKMKADRQKQEAYDKDYKSDLDVKGLLGQAGFRPETQDKLLNLIGVTSQSFLIGDRADFHLTSALS